MTICKSARICEATLICYVILAFLPTTNAAKAAEDVKTHCWCSVQCSVPDGKPLEMSKRWDRRPNGKKWRAPFTTKKWNECRDNCSEYVLDLHLQEIANERKTCGKVECASKYRIGAKDERQGPTRSVQVACETQLGPTYPQYPAKIVCGWDKSDGQNGLVEPGRYKTVVNIHNPQNARVRYRRKVAVAQLAQDGPISQFVSGTIGPDGSQYFNCAHIRTLIGTTGLIDGFFVLEAEQPLDVSAYYSSREAIGGVKSIDVERVAERSIHGNFCRPITNIPNATGITVFENTGGATPNFFPMNDPRLTTVIPTLNIQTNDIAGQTAAAPVPELYDVYLSDESGNQNNNGSCITINGQYNSPPLAGGPLGVGFNISRVEVNIPNGTTIVFNQIGSFAPGGGFVNGSEQLAIDGNTATATRLVNAPQPNHTARLTLCACQREN